MDELTLVVVLIVGVVVLTPAADKVRIPQPVLLTIFGLLLALLTPATQLDIEPDLILPVVLPPLLFAATQRTTVNEFREHAGAVLFLAVGLTLATLGVVALVAHTAGLPWPVAFVLGAMVSPPDPVAATAVARRLRLPHRLVTILEGEGMFNDATALVAYKVAVAAAVTGDLSAGGVGLELIEGIGAGILIGFFAAITTRLLLAAIHDGYAETTLTVLAPFAAYVGAERLNGSGVLAVLVLGLYLRSYAHDVTTSSGWLLGRAVWSYADFLITSLVFALLGFELVAVIRENPVSGDTIVLALLVTATLVVFRALWIFPSARFTGMRALRRDLPVPVGWREATVVSWAGMRGVVTVATALALPLTLKSGERFPYHDELVVVALVAVLLTLVVQGLTLTPLTGFLGVGSQRDESGEVSSLRLRAAKAGLDEVRNDVDACTDDQVREAAVLQYEGYLAAQDAMAKARITPTNDDETSAETDGTEDRAEVLRDLLSRATDAERQVVLRARRTGEVTAEAADEVLRDIEGRALRDF